MNKIYVFLLLMVLMYFLLSCGTQHYARESYAKAMLVRPFDAIIVPGIPYDGKNWGKVMKYRVLWSAILYRNGMTKNVIYSGGAVYTPYKEAIVMGLYAEKLGIPAAHIFYDTLARHSVENVYYSYLLAKQQGFKRIALATDNFQNFTLKGFIRKRFASPIYRLPAIKDSVIKYDSLNPVVNAESARVSDTANYKPITETETRWQRLKGTYGKNIPWGNYKEFKVPEL
jgi:hypothetical protein